MSRCKHRSAENPKMDSLMPIDEDNVYCPHCGKIIKPLSPNGDFLKDVDKIVTDYYNLIETINILTSNSDDEELNSFLDYMLGEEGVEKTRKMFNKALFEINKSQYLNMYDMESQGLIQKINIMNNLMDVMGGFKDQYPVFRQMQNVSNEMDNNSNNE
jgi:hypothetical protein